MTKKLIRLREVREKVGGLSRTTIWRLERDGKFPKRRRIGVNAVAWIETEIDAWIDARCKTS